MSTQNETSPADSGEKGRRPTHRLWLVQGQGKDATWTEIAGLWPTRSNIGYIGGVEKSLPLAGDKLMGRLIVLPAKFKSEAEAQEAAQ